MAYSPNALGQPTQVGAYASGVSFHPNGQLAGYLAGNGIAFSTTQNTRGLPLLWRHAGVVADTYGYDANGNVSSIGDGQEGGATSRTMGYDGLDRLTSASGIWGAGSFGYDALDNLRTSTVGSRVLSTTLDAGQRIGSTTVNGIATTLTYDANGNLRSKGAQGYGFDIGNRMSSATGKASYGYDGHGRRTLVSYTSGANRLQVYTQDGRLVLTQDSAQGRTEHLYLGSQLIGEVNSASGTSYLHTDALGSPVATTNGAAAILSRTRYEPYGGVAAGMNPKVHGYTGHAQDADTALVYMQQRYYEPVIGRFLSVDPVVADTKDGGLFNRYSYADYDPYGKVDPDGRQPRHPDAVLQRAQALGNAFNTIVRTQSASKATAQQSPATSLQPGTQGSSQGCIYCVSGKNTSSGRDYVGSTDNMGQRAKDTSDGRNRQRAEVVGTYDKGDKQGRRNAEQQAINDRGGKDKLDNKRNEVAPKDWGDRGIKPPDKSKGTDQ